MVKFICLKALIRSFSVRLLSRNSRQRDFIVGSKLWGLWLISRNTVFFGGSSRVFRSAFAALVFISSAQSIIATRLPPSLTEREKKDFKCRTSSTLMLDLKVFLFSSKLFLITASLGSDSARTLAVMVFLRSSSALSF